MNLALSIAGKPAAQGSKTIGRTKKGRVFVRESSKRVKPFRNAVAAAAAKAMDLAGLPIHTGPVSLTIVVRATRPTSHLLRSGTVKPGSPKYPGCHDASKVCRAVEDALAGIVYENDRQVRRLSIEFLYHGSHDTVEIMLTQL